MVNDLLLLSGNDIPFEQAQLVIHQPTVKEIGYIGEEAFFTGFEFMKFSKDNLSEEDKLHLEKVTNFEIIMSMMRENNPIVQRNKTCMMMILSLIFPTYEIQLDLNELKIVLTQDDRIYYLDKTNFDEFIKILEDMWSLEGSKADFNPAGDYAKRIADKLRRGRQKVAEARKSGQKIAILSRYVSILAVGVHKDINSLLNYTVYQLYDEYERFVLKTRYDLFIQAKMAGAKDIKEEKDWMGTDIHAENDDNLPNEIK